MARLHAVNVVHEIFRGPSRYTAIDKRPVAGPVTVNELGLVGDSQCDTRNHGGVDRALYAYAREDAAFWAATLDREIPPGLFGENLTTTGLAITGALVGERWRIGPPARGILVEVRAARTPCANLSAHVGVAKFHKRFLAEGRTGTYLKVLTPGTIQAGDIISIEHRPGQGVMIGDFFRRTVA